MLGQRLCSEYAVALLEAIKNREHPVKTTPVSRDCFVNARESLHDSNCDKVSALVQVQAQGKSL